MWYYLVGRYVKVGTRTNSCLILESIPRIGMYTSILGASAGEPLLFKNSKRKPKNISKSMARKPSRYYYLHIYPSGMLWF